MYYGVDLGGRHARGGLVIDGVLGEVIACDHNGGRDALCALDKIVQHGMSSGARAVGIGVPGLYDGTTLVKSGNLKALEGIDLDRYGIPVTLLHDITALRIGEEQYGHAQGRDRVAALNFGSGFSTCVSENGESWCKDKPQHACTKEFYGGWRTWEQVQRGIGADSVFNLYKERAKLRDEPVASSLRALWDLDTEEASWTRHDLVNYASDILERVRKVFSPDIYVLGGGQAGRLAPHLQERFPDLEIAVSDYVTSSIMGAAHAAMPACRSGTRKEYAAHAFS